jgi:hypothetical protein
MPRAIGRHAEVLLPRSGVNSRNAWVEGGRFIRHSNRHLRRNPLHRIRIECRLACAGSFGLVRTINPSTLHMTWLSRR